MGLSLQNKFIFGLLWVYSLIGGGQIAQTIVICTQCSAEFPSPIAFGDRKSFETSTLSGNTTKCPKCGSVVPCDKENMIFKD